jgi:hypothetical protein
MMTMITIVSHIAMDHIKVRYLGDTLPSFALDRGTHLAVIAAITDRHPDLSSRVGGPGYRVSSRHNYTPR